MVLTIWADFSRSFWYLFFLQTEIRQDTYTINCANIILNDSTRQTDPCATSGPHATKSLPKSATPPSRREACDYPTKPLSDYNGAARELWDFGNLGWSCLFVAVCTRTASQIDVTHSNTPSAPTVASQKNKQFAIV